jgi:CheY-like chemotaxis protein
MSRILVVEDDPDTQMLLTQYLTRNGYEVVSASNGWEALVTLDGEPFDLIVLDIMLPGLDGAKFLSILRGYVRKGLSLPVVVVTALEAHEAAERLRPNTPEALVEKKGGQFLAKMLDRIRQLLPPALDSIRGGGAVN